MMEPFSDFPYLRQGFTKAERWAVLPETLDLLSKRGLIDQRQNNQISQFGALGSHLENIQRGDGFKGFNQQKVSDIIRRTDPRSDAVAT